MKRNTLAALVLILVRVQALAGEPTPGEYISEDGWGNMLITSKPDGKLYFDIEATGLNGHSCGIEGGISHGKAELKDNPPDEACQVSFRSDAKGIDVVLGDEGQCRYYCGMHATFDGHYLVPQAGCHNNERKELRSQFTRRFDAQDFQGALTVLQPVLTSCEPTLHWLEEAQIRTDLSMTLYRLGRKDECLSMLKPIFDQYGKDEDAWKREFLPTDFDAFLPIAGVAQSNAQLCSSK